MQPHSNHGHDLLRLFLVLFLTWTYNFKSLKVHIFVCCNGKRQKKRNILLYNKKYRKGFSILRMHLEISFSECDKIQTHILCI